MSKVQTKGNEMKFDDLGTDGKLAVTDAAGNYEWVEARIEGIPSKSRLRVELVASGGDGDEAARQALREHLSEHYAIDIPCDFRSEAELASATAKATAIQNRFLSGNYAPFST
ncbi:hypothetical protein [Agrobacterium albertimagni]|nr:hypothetical protein [Agrobacterium albertimagni]